MAAGSVQIPVIDGGNTTRSFSGWSTAAGNLAGNLSFLQVLAGLDGLTPATAANAFPVQFSGGNLTSGGNVTVTSGNVTLGNSTATIGSLAANQTVDVTNTVNITGNLTNGGASTITSGNITNAQPAVTWTQTVANITANTTSVILNTNASRKGLRWMVTGANPVTIAPGNVTVTIGQGMNYSPGAGTGQQGGADSFGPNEISTQAFSANSTLGTTLVIWEGQ